MPPIRNRVQWAITGAASVFLAIFVTGPLGNRVDRLYEATGVYSFWGRPLALLGHVAAQPWFLWAFGLSVGLAIGVWLDGLLRRLNPTVIAWLQIEEAAEQYCSREIIQRREALRLEIEGILARKSEKMTELTSLSAARTVRDTRFQAPEPQEAQTTRLDLISVTAEEIAAMAKLRDANAARYPDIKRQLERRGLVAKGFISPVTPKSKPIPIPSEQWPLLQFALPDVAQGEGLRYSSVRIGKPAANA